MLGAPKVTKMPLLDGVEGMAFTLVNKNDALVGMKPSRNRVVSSAIRNYYSYCMRSLQRKG